MKCQSCGAGVELVRDTRDVPYTYKGKTVIIANVPADYCPSCGDSIMDPEQAQDYSDRLLAIRTEFNNGRYSAQYIAAVRKKLGLDQRAAGELFGGGVNAFGRYESGKTVPSVALVELLTILDGHPELLDEVKSRSVPHQPRK